MIINSANLRTLYIAFSAAYNRGFAGVKPTWGTIAEEVPSTTLQQEYGWLGEAPNVREWIGERQIENLGLYSYAIRNRNWEMTIGVDRNNIADDNIGLFSGRFEKMGRATAVFPDQLLWPMLPAGFVTPCYDGQYFFDTDHPVVDANGNTVSVSNTQGGAGTPWYLVDRLSGFKPLIYQNRQPFEFTEMTQTTDEEVFRKRLFRYGVDGRSNAGYGMWQVIYASRQPLTADSYGAARTAMFSMFGDRGRPLGLVPDLLIVPPALEQPALQILKADRNAAGAANVYMGTAELMLQPYLAS